MADLDSLTTTESARLASLESTIEQGLQTFVEVGNALLEIRESRLYRVNHSTFEDYCRERWGMARSTAYQLIDAAEVVSNVRNCGQILPANESQARPLSKLTPQLQREVWPIVVETAPDGKITANHVQHVVDNFLSDVAPSLAPLAHRNERGSDDLVDNSAPLVNGYNYKRDNRRSVSADIYTPQGMDARQTPAYALDPLLPYLPREWVIWEPACGEGLLEDALYDSGFATVVSGDILTGQNFFDYEPDAWDCLVTNPPYSVQFLWLERCYQLGKPFALLLKVETLGTKTAQELMQQYGFGMLLLDKRVDFKMPNLGWGDGERKSAAQFPVFWLCWKLLPGQIVFGKLDKKKQDEVLTES